MGFNCEESTKKFQEYVATYSDQELYESYSEQVFVDDMLYGIGISLNKANHEFSSGFDRFKEYLRNHLKK